MTIQKGKNRRLRSKFTMMYIPQRKLLEFPVGLTSVFAISFDDLCCFAIPWTKAYNLMKIMMEKDFLF